MSDTDQEIVVDAEHTIDLFIAGEAVLKAGDEAPTILDAEGNAMKAEVGFYRTVFVGQSVEGVMAWINEQPDPSRFVAVHFPLCETGDEMPSS